MTMIQKSNPERTVISYNRETCTDFYFATQHEWIETNGLGSYASSTIIGANVRRYHGLLVASLKPPTHRYVFLSKLEEIITLNGKNYDLATSQYPFVIFPQGHKLIERFEYDLCPAMVFQLDGTQIKKTILMIYGENTTIIRYEVLSGGHSVMAMIRPLCAFREHHQLAVENAGLNHNIVTGSNRLSMQPYAELPPLYIYYSRGIVDPKFYWYKNCEYRKEQERGLEFTEDVFAPCIISAHLNPGESLDIIASTDTNRFMTMQPGDSDELFQRELERRRQLIHAMPLKHRIASSLAMAADSFLVKRDCDNHSVIAGYHWFGDWSRDTMIALPGLTLTTGKTHIARKIILSYANFLSEGMLPNRFPDLDSEPEYNSVDGTLWYFNAIYQYYMKTSDLQFLQEHLYERLKEVIEWHIRGTRFNIKADDDGLLSAGQEGIQLTWMDAKIGDWVVTPRIGKPVEVNALWYNALSILSYFAGELNQDKDKKHFETLAERVALNFNKQFWCPEKQYLYDYICGDYKNADLRPNQILSISLPFAVLKPEYQKPVLRAVQEKLLTPFGLRTLSPDHPDYIEIYAGDVYHRDRAYHQGIVWAWLIAPFIEAYLKVHLPSPDTRTFCLNLIAHFEKQLNDQGVSTVSEIFDGNETHFPKGTISHATSVGEVLRALELVL